MWTLTTSVLHSCSKACDVLPSIHHLALRFHSHHNQPYKKNQLNHASFTKVWILSTSTRNLLHNIVQSLFLTGWTLGSTLKTGSYTPHRNSPVSLCTTPWAAWEDIPHNHLIGIQMPRVLILPASLCKLSVVGGYRQVLKLIFSKLRGLQICHQFCFSNVCLSVNLIKEWIQTYRHL